MVDFGFSLICFFCAPALLHSLISSFICQFSRGVLLRSGWSTFNIQIHSQQMFVCLVINRAKKKWSSCSSTVFLLTLSWKSISPYCIDSFENEVTIWLIAESECPLLYYPGATYHGLRSHFAIRDSGHLRSDALGEKKTRPLVKLTVFVLFSLCLISSAAYRRKVKVIVHNAAHPWTVRGMSWRSWFAWLTWHTWLPIVPCSAAVPL